MRFLYLALITLFTVSCLSDPTLDTTKRQYDLSFRVQSDPQIDRVVATAIDTTGASIIVEPSFYDGPFPADNQAISRSFVINIEQGAIVTFTFYAGDISVYSFSKKFGNDLTDEDITNSKVVGQANDAEFGDLIDSLNLGSSANPGQDLSDALIDYFLNEGSGSAQLNLTFLDSTYNQDLNTFYFNLLREAFVSDSLNIATISDNANLSYAIQWLKLNGEGGTSISDSAKSALTLSGNLADSLSVIYNDFFALSLTYDWESDWVYPNAGHLDKEQRDYQASVFHFNQKDTYLSQDTSFVCIEEPNDSNVNPFCIGRFEVTKKLFDNYTSEISTSFETHFAGAKYVPLDMSRMSDAYPVNYVNIYEALLFCNSLSKAHGFDTVYTYDSLTLFQKLGDQYMAELAGLNMDITKNGYRLPFYSEFREAMFGDNIDNSDYIFFWGKEYDETFHARYFSTDSAAVGQLYPNHLGLFDLVGNVGEFAHYGDYSEPITGASKALTTTCAVGGSFRISSGLEQYAKNWRVTGGINVGNAGDCMTSSKDFDYIKADQLGGVLDTKYVRNFNVGLRLVRTYNK